MIPGFGLGRAECLAAVALAVGARQDLTTALRRLASEDTSLRRLEALARRCESGEALPAALLACRLIGREDVATLTNLPPAVLAEELSRLAQSQAAPLAGEVLARWFPLWVVLAATVPSLIIGAVVAIMTGSLYGGLRATLGLAPAVHASGAYWLLQVATVLAAAGIAVGAWRLLGTTPWLGRITCFSSRLERASLANRLLRSVRQGRNREHSRALFAAWADQCGDRWAAWEALEHSGGDVASALIQIGLLPRRQDGQPDWEVALAEAELVHRQAAASVVPWLSAVLMVMAVWSFVVWDGFGMLIGVFQFY